MTAGPTDRTETKSSRWRILNCEREMIQPSSAPIAVTTSADASATRNVLRKPSQNARLANSAR